MPLIPIDNLDDPRLEPYRNLKSTNLTRWEQLFIVEGENSYGVYSKAILSLPTSWRETRTSTASPTFFPNHLPVYVVPTRGIDQLIGFPFHRGMLACGQRKPSIPLSLRFPDSCCGALHLRHLPRCHRSREPGNDHPHQSAGSGATCYSRAALDLLLPPHLTRLHGKQSQTPDCSIHRSGAGCHSIAKLRL